jgi:hypothetical protein
MSEVQPLFNIFPVDVCYLIQHHLSTLKCIPIELAKDIQLYPMIHVLIQNTTSIKKLTLFVKNATNDPLVRTVVPPYDCLIIPHLKSMWCKASPLTKQFIIDHY